MINLSERSKSHKDIIKRFHNFRILVRNSGATRGGGMPLHIEAEDKRSAKIQLKISKNQPFLEIFSPAELFSLLHNS